MNEKDEKLAAERALEAWVEEKGLLEASGPEDALVELLRTAHEGGQDLSDAEAAGILRRVHDRASTQRVRRVRPWLAWAAAAAAVLAAAKLSHRTAPPPPEAQLEVVKEVFFESVTDGKVVRFALTIYRPVERKEQKDVPKPSL